MHRAWVPGTYDLISLALQRAHVQAVQATLAALSAAALMAVEDAAWQSCAGHAVSPQGIICPLPRNLSLLVYEYIRSRKAFMLAMAQHGRTVQSRCRSNMAFAVRHIYDETSEHMHSSAAYLHEGTCWACAAA